MSNPFNAGSQQHEMFETLSDLEWHCGKCELPGTQPAKGIQNIRKNGFDVENGQIECRNCDRKTVHRRLKSTEPVREAVVRSDLPDRLKKRVKALFGNVEAVLNRQLQPKELEVDHRFPQVRWSSPES